MNLVSKEFLSDDVLKMYFCNFYILTAWGERAPQNRHVLTVLGEYYQDRLNCDHLKTRCFCKKVVNK